MNVVSNTCLNKLRSALDAATDGETETVDALDRLIAAAKAVLSSAGDHR